MYILGLSSKEMPIIQSWGEKYVHVPLNIEEISQLDSDGNKEKMFKYDCIECVELPLTNDKIVNAICKAHFGEKMDYIMANMHKSSDKIVKEYTEFLKNINSQCEKITF